MTEQEVDRAVTDAFRAFFANGRQEQTPEPPQRQHEPRHSGKSGIQVQPDQMDHGNTSSGDI